MQNSRKIIFAVYLTVYSASITLAQESLKQYATKYNLSIGTCTAFSAVNSNETSYMNILKKDFNTVVCENEMKFDVTEPSQGTFTFANADKIVSLAQQNNMKIRGHCLIWHSQIPNWVRQGNWNRQTLLAVMKSHINGVLNHYKGKVYEWDVVNEAFDDLSEGMRSSIWKNTIGEDFIDSAFVYAHEADPNALLVYNDYLTSTINFKSDAVYKKLKQMLENKIPINGVGFQSHQHIIEYYDNYYNDLIANFDRFAALGLNISITELDVRIPIPSNQTELDTQAKMYKAFMQAALSTPACKTFMFWGFSDKYSWVPQAFPGTGEALIYDLNYLPKPAYTSLLDVLKNYQPNKISYTRNNGHSTMEMSKNQVLYNLLGEKIGSYEISGVSLHAHCPLRTANQIYIGQDVNKSTVKIFNGR